MFGLSISVGSVAVDVVPSVRGFAEDLKAKLAGVSVGVDVTADTTAARAQIDELAQTRRSTIEVNADTARARAEIDTAARDRHSTITFDAIGNLGSSIFSLGGIVAGLGPALIPVTAAVAGLGAALVAPLALAGGGLTIGALIAGKAVADTEKQKKQIDQLAKAVASAKQNLANTQSSVAASSAISATSAQQSAQNAIKNALASLHSASTPAATAAAERRLAQARASLANSLATNQARASLSVANAQRKVTEATAAYDAALKGLSPAQARFLKSQQALKDSFKNLLSTAGPAIFGPLIQGMDLLAKVLPQLKPLLQGVADGIGTLLSDAGKAVSSSGFKDFIKSFGAGARGAIIAFGRIFENVGRGLVGFFRAFSPLSKAFVGALGGAAAGFANWTKSLGSSKSFQSFLAYIKDVGPKVADTLGHMFGALGKIAGVLAPLGGLSLALVDGLSKLILAASPGQLAAIAAGIGAIGLAVLFATGGLSGIVPAIVGLGAGLAYAYTHSTKFRSIIDAIGRVFTDHLFPALKDAWKTVLPGLVKGFDSVKQSVHDNQGLFRVLGDLFKTIGTVIIKGVIPAMAQVYSKELPLLGKAIGLGITAVRLWGDVWLSVVEVILIGFRLLTTSALNTFGAIVDAAATGLGWLPGIGPKILAAQGAFHKFRDGTVAALDAAIAKAQALHKELDFKPVTVKVKFDTRSPALNVGGVPIIKAEGAGARGAIINRPTVALIGDAGPERLTPLDQTPGNEPLPSGASGPQFNVERVYAQDVNDFLRQMQTRARLSSSDGVRR